MKDGIRIVDPFAQNFKAIQIDFAYRGRGCHGVADPNRRLEDDAGGEKNRAISRKLGAQQGRDIADGQRAMRHPAAEHGLARILLVEMHRVHVARGFAEQLHVALRHGAGIGIGLPDLQIFQ